MPGRKRSAKEPWDPNKSDPEDEDYDNRAVHRSPRKTTAKATTKKVKGRPRTKVRRKNSYIIDDDDEIDEVLDEISEEEYSGRDGTPEESIQRNARGRPKRGVTRKPITYEESDPEVDLPEDPVPIPGPIPEPLSDTQQTRPVRLKLKFHASELSQQTQARVTNVTSKELTRPPSSGRAARGSSVQRNLRVTPRGTSVGPRERQTSLEPARKSSRLHPELNEPLVAMTDSGHVDFITQKKQPSIVQEEEEEEGEDQDQDQDQEQDQEQDQDQDQYQEQHQQEQEQQAEEEQEDDIIPPSGQQMESEETIGTSMEAVHGSLEEAMDTGDVDAPGEADIDVTEVQHADAEYDDEDDDDDDAMPTRRTRGVRNASSAPQPTTPTSKDSASKAKATPTSSQSQTENREQFSSRIAKKSQQNLVPPPKETRRGGSQHRETSDEEYQEDEDASDSEISDLITSPSKKPKEPYVIEEDEEEYSGPGTRRSGRLKGSQGDGVSKRKRASPSEEELELEQEVAELQDSPAGRRTKRRATTRRDSSPGARRPKLRERTSRVDYRIINPETLFDDSALQPSVGDFLGPPGKKPQVPVLYGTSGPFGGWGAPAPIFGKTPFMGPTADSDSSDDEGQQRGGPSKGPGGAPTHPHLLPPQTLTNPQLPGPAGIQDNFNKLNPPTGMSKSGSGKSSADSDPLGIDQNVSFDSVGGHDEHIRQLREMVAMPLMYPEIFQQFGVSPPKGVLFHGPPGTGKTLMARALASSCSTQTGKKVTFFMRKGADCLSKWVGEAERQLRLLFEEAKNSQPSIIFFDEIDGLAPVRSSKQDQIHASIVSTLLALMDGMDGRGQIIVIGATNRPDAIDPALRRPGRFDREFYFPLPDVKARKKIIDIHTKSWVPPLSDKFREELAVQTKGFGGADLRGLCTEAALNAVQRVYPQLYQSWDKYIIDPKKIQVVASDFLKAIRKIIPSSERSSSSGAAPLPKHIQPLLSQPLDRIKEQLRLLLPERKRLTALEEAMYEDDHDPEKGFERELMMADFESSRVYRPRLLIHGYRGMGQQYIAAALLHHFEGCHVQSFDMASLMSDSSRTTEATMIQYFVEVKRHKPSVIFIPNIDTWYSTLPEQVIYTFTGLLRSISPNDPILLLGIAETEIDDLHTGLKELFGYASNNRHQLSSPSRVSRENYFRPIATNLKKSPRDFPDPTTRPKRVFETLPKAPPTPPHQPTKEELEAQTKRDGQIRNWLRISLMGWMEVSKNRFRKLKKPVIDQMAIGFLSKQPEPPPSDIVVSDIPQPVFRPYELDKDEEGRPMILEVQSGKKYYNMDIESVEMRISNGYYCLPRQFLEDIRLIAMDAQALATDKDRILRANELVANAEVFAADLESRDPSWLAECERLYLRQVEKDKNKEARRIAKAAKKAEKVPLAAAANTITNQSNGVSAHSPRKAGSPSKSLGPSKSADLHNLLHTPPPPLRGSGGAGSDTHLSNGYTPHTNESNGIVGGYAPITDTRLSDALPLTSSSDSNPSQAFHTAPATSRAVSSNQPSVNPYQQLAGSQPPAALLDFGRPSTKMPIGSVLVDTSPNSSSGKNSSQHSSGASSNNSNGTTQILSSGVPSQPDFSMYHDLSSGDSSQLPDTQVLSSDDSGRPSSQAYSVVTGSQPLPYSQPHSYPLASQQQSAPPVLEREFKVPEMKLTVNIEECNKIPSVLTQRTSGYSVEQLEQINAALMNTIWNMRTEWDREKVRKEVIITMNDVLRDIGAMQPLHNKSIDLSDRSGERQKR